MTERIKRNYHWLIAAVMLLQMFVQIGLYNNLNTVFILPVTEELKISRTAFSLSINTMKGLMGCLSTFLSGFLLTKVSFRKSITCFMITNTVAFVLMANSQSVLSLGLCAALLGLGDGICMSSGAQVIIRHWFHKYQGTVLGCVTAASGLGGSVMCILLTAVSKTVSWRAAFLTCSILTACMAVLLCLVVRDRPEQVGLQPYGVGQFKGKKKEKQEWEGLDMKQLLHRPSFYLMLVGTVFSCLCAYCGIQTLMPHVQGIGWSESSAAAIQSAMLLLLTVAKMGVGFLNDRLGAKKVTMICLLSGLLGLSILTFCTGKLMIIVGVVCISVSLPLTTLIVPLLTSALFGYRAQAVAVGVFMSMISVSSMVCGPLVNLVFDTVGSYRPAYAGMAVLMLITVGIYGLMYYLAEKDKKKICA